MKFKFMRNHGDYKRGDVVEGFLVNRRQAAIWRDVGGCKTVRFVPMEFNMKQRILVKLNENKGL